MNMLVHLLYDETANLPPLVDRVISVHRTTAGADDKQKKLMKVDPERWQNLKVRSYTEER